MSDAPTSAVSPFLAGLAGRCPRCGRGRLFQGLLRVAERCGACGLDFGFADTGDGPAVFVILAIGFLVLGAALIVEMAFQPPYWVHAALWLPATAILSLALLRPVKGLLVALQFRHLTEDHGRPDK